RAALRADRVRRRSRDRQGHIGTGGGAQRLRPVRRSLSGRSGAVESDRSRTTKSQVDRDRRSGTQGRTPMTAIRVLVGTRKGAFILTSDGKREQWTVAGPHFAGWEVYHMKGSPADPDRIYASQSSSWFGQVIQRSRDGGRTWEQPASMDDPVPADDGSGMPRGESNKFVYDTSAETGRPLTTHMWYDGTQHPWEFARVWHLEPSPHDPDLVYAGVEDAALFRSTDGGGSWHGLAGLGGHESGPSWQPGAGGMCLRTILIDRDKPERMFTAISAAGAFRTEDGGRSWRPVNKGLVSNFIPDPTAEVGHCVHRIAMHPSRPNVLFMQKHWDVMRSDDGGDSRTEVSGDLPSDFGFPRSAERR